jgi:hypothetical protein
MSWYSEQSEAQIQKAILDYLEYRRDVYFFRAGSGVVQIKGSKGQRDRFFKSGKPGVPDIIVCQGGKFIGLEVKKEGGKQSKIQMEAEQDISKSGGQYHLVYSVDDVIAILDR